MPDNAAAYEVADKIGEAFASLDAANFEPILADDCVVWHNTDRATQNKTENIAYMAHFLANCQEVAFTEIRRQTTPVGYVQQHLTVGRLTNGNRFEIPVCHVAEVTNGLLKRIDEYFDPAPFVAAMAPT